MLTLKKINKFFPGVHALNNVDFELKAGEIHALLGENGAGKSTLIKVLTGAYPLVAPTDSGEIFLNDQSIAPRSPADAQAVGISTVYQEVNLLPNLSVAHNVYLGREPRRFGCINWKKIVRDTQSLLTRFNLDIDVNQSLSSYSIAIQQLVAIARGVDCSAKVLILDEPTASLDADEVELLFSILRELKAQGIAIIFVTHFLDQVYAITDRISVLRNGQHIGTFETAKLERSQLIAHMLGKELQELEHNKTQHQIQSTAVPAVSVNQLAAKNGISGISFSAQKGEALGLAGLLGSGRTEICETLFGIAEKTEGEIKLGDASFDPKSPYDAIQHDIALCPEDRKTEGIIGPLSIRENVILAVQARRGWWKPIPLKEQIQIAERAVKDLNIVCPHIEKAIGELSGGNQQKVILARWLANSPKILILDEPTRGIDIGAHTEIIKLIRKLCEEGLTLIVASSEIEELVAFSDKVIVMRDRKSIAELTNEDISENAILAAIAKAS